MKLLSYYIALVQTSLIMMEQLGINNVTIKVFDISPTYIKILSTGLNPGRRRPLKIRTLVCFRPK